MISVRGGGHPLNAIYKQAKKGFCSSSNDSRLREGDLWPHTKSVLGGLMNGERWALARAITLVETTHAEKAKEAQRLMTLVTQLHQKSSLASFRIGLSGPPGAGKSTFIERFGSNLTSYGHKVAVLAVDPSSCTTGGSLLGDKTRMVELSRNPNAYVRPSPNRGHLGGVTRTTNEAITLCETAGFDIVLVETVGVGQSEYKVSDMVDVFCLILAPGAGDELQGIKRGIVEKSDLIIVNKADGDLLPAARRTAMEYVSALKFVRPKSKLWMPQVLMLSSRSGEGLDEAWGVMQNLRKVLEDSGELQRRRAEQRKLWMWTYIQDQLLHMFQCHAGVQRLRWEMEQLVAKHSISPGTASDRLIQEFLRR